MASQGPLYPATVSTLSAAPESANDWLNAANVGANDTAEATITAPTYDADDISFQLIAANFGFTVPSDATINGITVEIEQDIAAGAAVDNRVQLRDATGTLVGANKATATAWPASPTIATYGGAADTWTASPTAAMVNDPDFGVVLSVKATAANTDIGVDFIRVTVHYTPNPNVTVTPSTASLTLTTYAPTVSTSLTAALVVADKASLTAGDTVVRNRLIALGYTVTLVSDDDSADTSRDLVVICESCTAATVGAKYKNVTMPVLILEQGVVDDGDLSTVVPSVGASEDNIVILDTAHGMADGKSGTVAVMSPAARIDYNNAADLPAAAQQVYSTEASSTQIVTYGYEAGATMANSHVAEARRAYCGLGPDASLTSLTTAGLELLDAAIEWVAPAATSVTVTPTTASLTIATFAPTVSTPQTLTPGVASLTTATFAPTVAVSNNQRVTPTTASLTTATFAPTVSTSNNQSVTPSTAALATSTFAPTVTATAHQTVTPTTASLATSLFAPTVTASDHKSVTPATVALVTATFAPTVSVTAHQSVTPTTAVLTTATFAPTVSTTAHQSVTPAAASLTLSTFAPTVTGGAGLTVTPTTATLSLATFAPTVATPVAVTPGVATLGLTTFAPTVTSSAGQSVTPTTASLTLTTFAPTVLTPLVVTPAAATLVIAAFAPTVLTPSVVTPTTATLTLTTFAPSATTDTLTIGSAVISLVERVAAALGLTERYAASLTLTLRYEAALSVATEYDLNDTASPSVTFTVDSVATDPTTITLTVIPPDKNTATYTYAGGTVTKSSTGIYTKDITLDQRGVWYLRFAGTGACQAAAEATVRVRA